MFTLASIIVRNEFCQDVEDAGGLQYLLDIMTNFTDEEKINCQALKLIKALAGNDDVKAHIITSGSAPLIVSAISRLRVTLKPNTSFSVILLRNCKLLRSAIL